ncbi:MAG TPA: hemerythrin domain-containing protein [bacterium]|nr:hemerythrin domain-containing protein [bacterium]
MKREKFLWPLTQSHHRGLVLAKHIREKLVDCPRGEEGTRVKAALEEVRGAYEGELRQHFWDEERILALYEAQLGTGEPMPERIRKDHRSLEMLMKQGDRESLLAFAETLTAHIRFEEEELFPGWERVFGDPDRGSVEKILRDAAGKSCPS